MSKILCYGSLNLDYVYNVDHFVSGGETLASDSLNVIAGGKGLNQAIAAARAGAEVYHAGKIGHNGKMLKDILEENGVNTQNVREAEGENGHAIIQVDKSGQNCILLFSGTNAEIKRDEIDKTLNEFEKGDWLILQNEINELPYIVDKAYEKGLRVVFNPSPINEKIFEIDFSKITYLILNEVEGEALTGFCDKNKILSALREKYKINLLLTLGKNGSVYYDGENMIETGIFEIKAVDTTAAGDTMLGYFVAGIDSGENPKKVLLQASKAAAVAVSRFGAAPSIPKKEELDGISLKYKKSVPN